LPVSYAILLIDFGLIEMDKLAVENLTRLGRLGCYLATGVI
jgi:hypothetical protein